MKVIHTEADWNKYWLDCIKTDKNIGLVPTMGALHQGHLDLVRQAKSSTDIVIASIFVNPTQFNNQEDFDNYPITLEQDLEKLEKEKVDYVFVPDTDTMYPSQPKLSIDFGELERVLEGAFRPGHFNGVGIIVAKLFNIIRPHKAFFGQKDLQQTGIIKRLVSDLSIPVQLEIVPTRREKDGLAMSSRNVRLSQEERQASLLLYSSLTKAKEELLAKQPWLKVQQQIHRDFEQAPLAKLEYFELIHPESFEGYSEFDLKQKSSICVAAYIGNVRLIDNLPIIP
ncbi:pantoate--beta-alanine ligase [Algoriphagus halophytocola]|uniref:Pantothenate synthetase n=1 Tax=Algoriphagus halophytocola TaxID=2991499 RepID=A0ABY6MG78_9BACT|nr:MULTISPECIES: pantoate--beta-alanine ligase [unclassified Algoriphagus]UZD21326.1 pantoate--beta-alanine ligase [Algoriphagus sp. TR-M5]WBL42537.1 pantoate--beta-alanine ligase [Algoriphagus sp. TR-M9]